MVSLAFFEGRWSLERVIAAEGARMIGEAVFTPAADGALDYREEGRLTLASGQVIAAFRAYRYVQAEDRIVVRFADGQSRGAHFVDIRPRPDIGGLVANDTHLCSPDRYDVTYRFTLPDRFETEITVTGPRKRYTAATRFERLARLAD